VPMVAVVPAADAVVEVSSAEAGPDCEVAMVCLPENSDDIDGATDAKSDGGSKLSVPNCGRLASAGEVLIDRCRGLVAGCVCNPDAFSVEQVDIIEVLSFGPLNSVPSVVVDVADSLRGPRVSERELG
jgi:hypothetical protein